MLTLVIDIRRKDVNDITLT